MIRNCMHYCNVSIFYSLFYIFHRLRFFHQVAEESPSGNCQSSDVIKHKNIFTMGICIYM